MSSALGDKKGRVANSSDLTRLRRQTAELAAYATYTGLSVNKKAKQQLTTDRKFTLGRGGLTLISDSTTGFTRNPVTGQIVVAPYTPIPEASFLFIAGGTGTNRIVYSSDSGTTWIASTSGNTLFGDRVSAIAWNGSMWVAGGGSYGGITSARLAYSYDGITWYPSTNGNALFDLMVQGIGSSSTMWVAVGYSSVNKFAYSYDGINWTASTSGNSLMNGVRKVVWNGAIWVAGGNGANRLVYSYDGINWTASTSGNTLFLVGEDVYALAWNGTIWVAGGGFGSNKVAYSSDGINWTASTSGNSIFVGASVSVFGVDWNGKMWVAGATGITGTNKLAYSYDGINWSASTSGNALFTSTNYVSSIVGSPTKWVAGGGNGTNKIVFSSDGINWTASTSGNSNFSTGNVYTIAYR